MIPPSSCSTKFQQRFVWPFVGWCLFVAPILVIIAGYFCLPNMLAGFLLLRTEGKSNEYVWDCFCLAAMGLFVSAFGVAIVRVFDLYGNLQFGYEHQSDSVHRPYDIRTTDYFWWTSKSTAWPYFLMAIWLTTAFMYPMTCFWITRNDLSRIPESSMVANEIDLQLEFALVGTVSGLVFGCAVLLIISIVHLLWTRRIPSACGLLPWEDVAARILEKFLGRIEPESVVDPVILPATETTVVTRWLKRVLGQGLFDDSTGKILPGHKQLGLMMLSAGMGYYFLFDSSYRDFGWSSATYHVGVYALLLMFLIGGILALACFILGRIRLHGASIVPAVIVVALLLLLVFRFGNWIFIDANRYFSIIESEATNRIEDANKISSSDESLGAFSRISAQKRKQSDAKRLPLREIYRDWNFPKAHNGKRTMVVVSASGGGIQASAWTAKVLANIDAECPAFSESVGLVSGVSGGSVGLMYYIAHRGFRENPSDKETDRNQDINAKFMRLSDASRNHIEAAASASSLEAIGWGLAFPDLIKSIPVLSRLVGKEDDRGLALESQWWNRMGSDPSQASQMRELRMRDLVSATNQGLVPPVIFNATTVETGQRMMIANFETNREATASLDTTQQIDYERCMTPIDFFGFYEPLFANPMDVNPRVSSAVRLSASFAYATPVARPIVPTERISPNANSALLRRANYHLCDGGYSDNTGLVAAVSVIRDLIDQYIEANEEPPFDQILFLSIESFPDNQIELENDATGLSSGVYGPLTSIFAARVASQAERSELELDLLIRADDDSFSKLNEAELMAAFDVDQYDTYLQLARRVMTLIAGSKKLEDEVKEELTGLLAPITKVQLRTSLESGKKQLPVSQVKSIKNKALSILSEKQTFDDAMSKAFEEDDLAITQQFAEATEALSVVALPENSPTVAAANSPFTLSIAAIQFRFNPNEAPLGGSETKRSKEDTKIPNPPLSWMLSNYDKHRINLAWKNQLVRIRDQGPSKAGPSKTEGKSNISLAPLERVHEFFPSKEKE